MPKVSVILTSFNHEKFIREAIDSVLDQTVTDFELIIWDDASSDKSWEIICGYTDSRVKAIRNEQSRRGIYGINKAISEMAVGEYIAIHHSDDVWAPDKLEKQIAYLDTHSEIGAVFTNALAVAENGSPLPDGNHHYSNIFNQPNRTRHEWLRFFFNRGNALCHPSVLIRKTCYEDCGLYRYGFAQLGDFDMWIRLCLKYEIHILPEKLVRFRVRDNEANSSGSRPESRIRTAYEFYKLLPHYRALTCFEDLVKVFPAAEKYRRNEETDMDFALGMAVLEQRSYPFTQLFGQDLLFDVISDPKRAENIKRIYRFDYKRFIALTGANDVFSIEVPIETNAELINQIYASSSWRITRPLRFLGRMLRSTPHFKMRNPFWSILRRIRHDGGMQHSFAKILRALRREGMRGIVARISELPRNDYKKWVGRYDVLTNETRATMRDRIETFQKRPLISVVMPTYNSNPEWLAAAIESVRRQIYPNWELCIADDASSDNTTGSILDRYARQDARIKVVMRPQNGHISAASNSALDLATGEWVALLDHDDLLSEHALFWVVDAMNKNPAVSLIYSDEDRIDEGGRRYGPYFKCDWNEDLFYSHNMISHLGIYRTDILREIGGFRLGMEGAQDYDLALRYIEKIEPNQIHHIPRVLYHWREHAGSTARSGDAKSYALAAGQRALNEHFARKKIHAAAELTPYGYRVHYALPNIPPMVSLIIPSRNALHLLRRCIESILHKTSYPSYEVLIIDNGSDDPATLKYLDDLGLDARVRVVRDARPFNYSALNNDALKWAQGDVIGLLNNDLEVITPDWLSEMVSIALQPSVGAVGAKLLYPDNTLQHAGVILGIGGCAGHSHKHLAGHRPGYAGRAALMQSFSAVTAACLIIRKELYERMGGLNERDLQVAFNDVDFCMRVREAGYRNVWTPYAQLYHHESATRGLENTPEKRARFAKELYYMKKRWGDLLLHDPAYSPNLTLDREDFSYAWPPRVSET